MSPQRSGRAQDIASTVVRAVEQAAPKLGLRAQNKLDHALAAARALAASHGLRLTDEQWPARSSRRRSRRSRGQELRSKRRQGQAYHEPPANGRGLSLCSEAADGSRRPRPAVQHHWLAVQQLQHLRLGQSKFMQEDAHEEVAVIFGIVRQWYGEHAAWSMKSESLRMITYVAGFASQGPQARKKFPLAENRGNLALVFRRHTPDRR
ncbi:MAG: hypothetical protein IRZ11_03295 [Clostridia bacterium]|nr:hypothetical protein [Clostridia bacterium]